MHQSGLNQYSKLHHRRRIMDGIKPELQEAVERICDVTGTRRPEVYGTAVCACGELGCALEVGVCILANGKLELYVGGQVDSFFEVDELWAILCHEVGHIHNGDLGTPGSSPRRPVHLVGREHMQEYAADEFVGRHGMGESLVRAFKRLITAGLLDGSDICDTHPPLNDRIARLQRRSLKQAA